MSRRIFLDPERERRFRRDGYVIVDLLAPDEVEQLLRYYETVADKHRDDFSASVLMDDLHSRAEIHDTVGRAFARGLPEILDDYRIAVASFAVKLPNSEFSRVGVHQDFMFVEEEDERAGISLWCPLVDVDARNGYLGVLPGSQSFNSRFREPCSLPYPDLIDLVEENFLRHVPMRAGQAMFMDNRLFHGSPPNRSPNIRVVAAAVVVPSERGLVYCHRERDDNVGILEIFDVPNDFYLKHTVGDRPGEGRHRMTVERIVDPLSESQLNRHWQSLASQ